MRRPDWYRDPRDRWSQPQNRAGRWYDISNSDTDRATVRIFDEIGWFGTDAATFASELDEIAAREIDVEINSPGGNVFDGVAIMNALRMHPATVTTTVVGVAASIASVIAQAGDRRLVLPSATLMIHEPYTGTIGNAADHRSAAAVLEQLGTTLAEIYTSRSPKGLDHFKSRMAAETWYTAREAVDEGLADEIIEPDRAGQSARSSASLMAMKLALAST